MKRIFICLLMLIMCSNLAFANSSYSRENLQQKRHFSVMNPFAENIVEHVIKSSLNREAKGKYKVTFRGYTLSSMRQGIFKYLRIQGKDVVSRDIPLPYVFLETKTDYNYIDYTKSPMEFKSDMEFIYEVHFSEDSINKALEDKQYDKVLAKINNIAYPLFEIKGASVKIQNNQMYVLTEYNFPVAPSSKNKVFVATSDLTVIDGKIQAKNVRINSAYGNLSLRKVTNLLNLLNPLDYTLNFLSSNQAKANVENVKIVDNIIKINGKIFIKGE